MTTRHQRTRRTIALVMSCLLSALAVTAPVVDAASGGTDVAVESEHDPSSCPPGHDHTICTQVEANASLETARARHEAHAAESVIRAAALQTPRLPSVLFRTHPSRAPPVA